MNYFFYGILLGSWSFLMSCTPKANLEEQNTTSTILLSEADYKNQIVTTEANFAKMADEKGIAEAFYEYADEKATIKRANDSLIYGKTAIRDFYQANSSPNGKLEWKPDFVEVSKQGDMAYSYGHYHWTSTDSLGNTKKATGVYNTVWKRQKDGTWKFIWD